MRARAFLECDSDLELVSKARHITDPRRLQEASTKRYHQSLCLGLCHGTIGFVGMGAKCPGCIALAQVLAVLSRSRFALQASEPGTEY